MAKQAAKKPAAKAKKLTLKSSLYLKGEGVIPAGTEVTPAMEKAFNDFQEAAFDKSDFRNKKLDLPTIDSICE